LGLIYRFINISPKIPGEEFQKAVGWHILENLDEEGAKGA